MELSLSEEQEMLVDLVRRICEDHGASADLRAAEASAAGFSEALWAALIEQGVGGVQIPAAYGGLGLGALEGAALYGELGRALAATPHFVSCMLAARLIALAGAADQKARWLPALAAGETCLSLASLEPGGDFSRAGVQLTAEASGEDVLLTGRKHFAPYAGRVDALVVLARRRRGDEHAVIAAVVDAKAPGVSIVRQHDLAGEPHASVGFANVRVAAADLLNGGGDIWEHWRGAMFDSLIPLAAQAVGAARRAHELSVAYAKQREAFGRPIGGFQAIAHDLAEALVAIRGAEVLVWQAAWARDAGRPFHRLAAMAKFQACGVLRKVASLAIQVHGGLGYTTACDVQLYFRRAKSWQMLNWDLATLETEIADLSLARAPAEARHV